MQTASSPQGIAPFFSAFRPAPRNSTQGFSLVEVALAIGVIAFAFVAILGLLPTGMNSFRHSIDTTIGSQIVQRIVNEAKETNWTDLMVAYPNANAVSDRYFDDQGEEVIPGTARPDGSKPQYLYHVQVRVNTKNTWPGGGISPNLATMSIRIANDPAHTGRALVPLGSVSYRESFAYIARNQDIEPTH